MNDNYENDPDHPEEEQPQKQSSWNDFYHSSDAKPSDSHSDVPPSEYHYAYHKRHTQNPFEDDPFKKREPGGTKLILGIILSLLAAIVLGFGIYGIYVTYNQTSSQQPNKSSGSSQNDEGSNGPSIQIVDRDKDENALSGPEVYKKCAPSVVGIINRPEDSGFIFEGGQQSGGSGVIMSEDGYIITNAHVVLGQHGRRGQITVLINDVEHEAKIIGVDVKTDIAVIKIDASGLPVAEFGNSDQIEIGETIYAIGNPLGFKFSKSMSRGIVSGINRSLQGIVPIGQAVPYIQTDAEINHGNSGGPIVDGKGRVVGITNISFSGADATVNGLNFAIPINTVKTVADELIKKGHVTRPVLGIKMQPVTPYLAQKYKVPQGICITGFYSDSDLPAKGVKKDDIITKINGIDATDEEAFHKALELENRTVGDSVTLTIYRMASLSDRAGKTFDVKVVLVEDKGDANPISND